MPRKSRQKCPRCQSCEVIPLLGALPGFAPYDTADVGRIPAAECAGMEAEVEAETEWECESCGEHWQEKQKLPAN